MVPLMVAQSNIKIRIDRQSSPFLCFLVCPLFVDISLPLKGVLISTHVLSKTDQHISTRSSFGLAIQGSLQGSGSVVSRDLYTDQDALIWGV